MLMKSIRIHVILISVILSRIIVAKQNGTGLNELQSKVIEGVPANIENFPFAAIFFNGDLLCAGVILNSYSILTAAHCFNFNTDKSKMLIEINTTHIKEYDGEMYEILSFLIHEDYNRLISFYADIAIIFLKESIKFGKGKKRALLSNNDDWMKKSNINITVIGWGWTKYGGPMSEGLLQTNLQFVPRSKCEKQHSTKIPEDMFCLYGDGRRDTCKGDSGSGVVWNKIVIGLVSHGDGCAKKDKPSIYINVYYHRRWIKNKLIKFFRNYCKLKERLEKQRYDNKSNTCF